MHDAFFFSVTFLHAVDIVLRLVLEIESTDGLAMSVKMPL